MLCSVSSVAWTIVGPGHNILVLPVLSVRVRAGQPARHRRRHRVPARGLGAAGCLQIALQFCIEIGFINVTTGTVQRGSVQKLCCYCCCYVCIEEQEPARVQPKITPAKQLRLY